jgi:hypothetical protein
LVSRRLQIRGVFHDELLDTSFEPLDPRGYKGSRENVDARVCMRESERAITCPPFARSFARLSLRAHMAASRINDARSAPL